MKNESVSVGSKVTTLVDENAQRKYLRIVNASSSTIFLGFDENLTASQGSPIPANGVFEIRRGNMFKGAIYAITSSGTSDVRIMEF